MPGSTKEQRIMGVGQAGGCWGYIHSQRGRRFREEGASLFMGVRRGWLALSNGLACKLVLKPELSAAGSWSLWWGCPPPVCLSDCWQEFGLALPE